MVFLLFFKGPADDDVDAVSDAADEALASVDNAEVSATIAVAIAGVVTAVVSPPPLSSSVPGVWMVVWLVVVVVVVPLPLPSVMAGGDGEGE